MNSIGIIDPIGVPAETALPSVGWTDVKVQRAWRTAAALIALLAASSFGIMALAGKAAYLAAAIPLAAASAYLFRSRGGLYDFQDPEELARIRASAVKMPLAKVIETYGWGPLFRYRILSPPAFEKAFSSHADSVPFNSLLSFYETSEAELKKAGSSPFAIPQPERWRGKFAAETEKMTCREILSAYPIEKLVCYRILGEPSYQILVETRRETTRFAEAQKAMEMEFARKTKPEREHFLQKADLAKRKYDTSALASQLSQLHGSYIYSVDSEERIAQAGLQAEQALAHAADPALRSAAAARCAAIREALEIRKGTLYQFYAQASSAIQAQILSLQELKQAEIAEARAEFDRAVKPAWEELDARIAFAKAELNRRLRELDAAYRNTAEEPSQPQGIPCVFGLSASFFTFLSSCAAHLL